MKIIADTCRYVISSSDSNGVLLYQKFTTKDNRFKANSSLKDIISIIKKRRHHVLTATLALTLAFSILACTLTALFVTPLAVFLAFVPAMVAGFVTGDYLFEKKAFFIRLRYNLDMHDGASFQALSDSVIDLMRSDYVWHVNSVTRNFDKKRHGASAELYERVPLRRYRDRPSWLVTTIDIPALRQATMALFFFPDFLLIKQQNSITALPYEEILLQYREKAFIEYEFMPRDARVIRRTWLHPNRDDSPDLRFKVNPEIPVMLYGELTISSYSGLHIRLLITNTNCAKAFSDLLGPMASHYEAHPANPLPADKASKHETVNNSFTSNEERERYYWEQRNKAYSRKKKARTGKQQVTENQDRGVAPHHVLGVPLNASEDEIKRAYRSLAKKFHPDRYTASGLKETALAGEIFKKITAAYEMIKKKKKG